MPMIRIEMFPGRSTEQKAKWAKAITESFVAFCGGTAQSLQIVFAEVDSSNWAMAGEIVSERQAAQGKKE